MIRNGDIVFCIRDYSKGSTTYFKKGQRYKIEEVLSKDCNPIVDIGSPFNGYTINTPFNLDSFSRKNMTGLCKICPIASKCINVGAPYFSRHFISITEERRKKLEKLKNQ